MPNMFDLNELCEQCDVTARTVRYYIQQGLLPSPGLGAGVRYSEGHLARLRLIRRLQREHLPLAEIRHRLEALDDVAVQRLLVTSAPAGGTPTTAAVDYVRAVLSGAADVYLYVRRQRDALPMGALDHGRLRGGGARRSLTLRVPVLAARRPAEHRSHVVDRRCRGRAACGSRCH